MSDLEPIQQSRLGEIGQILAKAREEKGLTLEEVSGKTLIRAAILKAIEEGDDRPLPEPVYIRGFIRRFGDLVGLNGMELCDSFPWQPSGNVPLSFVSAGNIVASSPAAQKPLEAAAPATPELEVEPSDLEPLEAPSLELDAFGEDALIDSSDVALAADEPLTASGEEGFEAPDHSGASASDVVEAHSEIELETPQEAALEVQELVDEPVSAEAPPLPDHEAAYDSRAALFDDEAAEPDVAAVAAVTGGAAAIAATSQSGTGNAATASVGSENSASSTASAGAGVATLPPPPAPVMYREPEDRNLMPWILACVAGAVGLGVAALAFGGGDRPNVPAVANDPAPIERVEATGNGAAVSGSEVTAPASTTPKAAAVPAGKVVLELEVKGTEEAWMDVLVDGELQIEGNQVPGFKQRWEGSQEIELATARPDMVWISVNGSQSQPFGKFEEAQPVKIGGFKPANAQ